MHHRGFSRFVFSVFLVFACLYTLSIGRGFYSSDGEVMFMTTAALVENGSFALDPDPALPQIVAGEDGRFYSKYDPGLSLAMVPFYVVGDWIAAINAAHRYRVAATAVLFLPALAAAGAVAGVTRLALRLTDHRRTLWIALAAGIASPLWWYGRVLFAEAVLAWALVMVVGLAWGEAASGHVASKTKSGSPQRSQRTQRKTGEQGTAPAQSGVAFVSGAIRELPLRILLAGIVFGTGIAARAAFAIYVPALLWLIWRGGVGDAVRDRARRVIAFVVGTVPGVALVLWHNTLRFGDPFTMGYAGESFTASLWNGVAGLLISPGRGALIVAPALILSVLLWTRLRRAAPALAEFLALAWGSALVFYGAWWAWDGGWCWGPRFLVPLIAPSMLPLGMLPESRVWRVALAVVVLVGIALNGAAVLVDIVPHYAAVAGESAADVDRINWTLRDGLPAAAWERVLRGDTEPFALFHLDDTGLPVSWTAGMPAMVCAGLALGVWLILRSSRAARG